jgi:hypothetical protein
MQPSEDVQRRSDMAIRLPSERVVLIVQITISGYQYGHACTAGRLHVTLGITDIEALWRCNAQQVCGM